MVSEFRLPALGADMDEGTIVEWHVGPGSRVKRGDVVAVVETDKGAIDVEIFEDGVVREIVVQPGTRIPVGTVLAILDVEGAAMVPSAEATAEPAVAAALPAAALAESTGGVTSGAPTLTTSRARISPAARKRARELGIDVETLRGTGPGGAVTIEDVERANAASAPVAGAAATATPSGEAPAVPAAFATARPSEVPPPTVAEVTAAAPVRKPSEGMRDAIAAAMSRSKREIPHYYLSTAVDVTVATEWLAAHNAAVPVTARLLFAALLVKSIALACRATPGFSGFYREGRYEESPAVHIGVAVAIRGGGLVAPAIMDADTKPLAVLMEDFRALVLRARAGRLRASELAAPTIILTSLGDSAVDTVFPIIQPPQVAIVGAGAVVERPWVMGGQVMPRQVLTLSLGADHRVTDGRLGAQFLARIAERLGRPEAL